ATAGATTPIRSATTSRLRKNKRIGVSLVDTVLAVEEAAGLVGKRIHGFVVFEHPAQLAVVVARGVAGLHDLVDHQGVNAPAAVLGNHAHQHRAETLHLAQAGQQLAPAGGEQPAVRDAAQDLVDVGYAHDHADGPAL